MDLSPQSGLVEHAEYICTQCPEGYTGDHCQVCDDGYYGNPLQLGSSCRRCECDGGPCNVTTGACITCLGNTEGWHCERCKLGYWGDPAVGCESCNCYADGSESALCDSSDGQCLCKPRFAGQKCDTCDVGFAYLDLQCLPCNCDPLGSGVSDNCNAITGQCECKPGVIGVKCQECQDGFFGMNGLAEDLAALHLLSEQDADWEEELGDNDEDRLDAVACAGESYEVAYTNIRVLKLFIIYLNIYEKKNYIHFMLKYFQYQVDYKIVPCRANQYILTYQAIPCIYYKIKIYV